MLRDQESPSPLTGFPRIGLELTFLVGLAGGGCHGRSLEFWPYAARLEAKGFGTPTKARPPGVNPWSSHHKILPEEMRIIFCGLGPSPSRAGGDTGSEKRYHERLNAHRFIPRWQ
jgi:hypothetical protein